MTINGLLLNKRSTMSSFSPDTSDTLSTTDSDFSSALEDLDARLTLALKKSERALSEARKLLTSARQPFPMYMSTAERLMLYRAAQPKTSFSGDAYLEETHIPGIQRIRTDPHARAGPGEVNEQRHTRWESVSSTKFDYRNTSSPQPAIHPKALHIHIWLQTLPDNPVLAMHLPASFPPTLQARSSCTTGLADPACASVPDLKSSPKRTLGENLDRPSPPQQLLGKRSFEEIFDRWEARRDPEGPKLGKLRKGESPEGDMIEHLFGMRRG
ncbi:hypothetical protein PRZ48_008387 [Zasmidium cellare]|uniref:Uncharacterized protein n=1 Tax=Zasmidium cellare TaxID=395010 RepID=A0ABR0EG10_ZASCE|nr:hypothetical protein PRZ48_008387 [Zasmidium cellare]